MSDGWSRNEARDVVRHIQEMNKLQEISWHYWRQHPKESSVLLEYRPTVYEEYLMKDLCWGVHKGKWDIKEINRYKEGYWQRKVIAVGGKFGDETC